MQTSRYQVVQIRKFYWFTFYTRGWSSTLGVSRRNALQQEEPTWDGRAWLHIHSSKGLMRVSRLAVRVLWELLWKARKRSCFTLSLDTLWDPKPVVCSFCLYSRSTAWVNLEKLGSAELIASLTLVFVNASISKMNATKDLDREYLCYNQFQSFTTEHCCGLFLLQSMACVEIKRFQNSRVLRPNDFEQQSAP